MKYCVNDNLYDVKVNINKRLKYIKISVADNIIMIKTPKALKDDFVEKILDNNYDFLEKNIDYTRPKADKNMTYIFGERYGVKRLQSSKNNVYIDDEYLVIETKNLDDEYIDKLAAKFLISQLEGVLYDYIDQAKFDFKNDVNTDVSITLKKVRSYYGKCKPYESQMYFSYLLAKIPKDLIKYVVYHEFAHLKHLNHSKNFYKYLDSKLTGASLLDKKLRKIKVFDAF